MKLLFVFVDHDDVEPFKGEGPRLVFTKVGDDGKDQPYALYPPNNTEIGRLTHDLDDFINNHASQKPLRFKVTKSDKYLKIEGIERNALTQIWDLLVKRRWKP